MTENFRGKQGFAYDFEVRCGGCLRWVHEVYADSREAGAAEKGRCRECVAASPIVVEAGPEPPVVVVEGEPEEGIANTCPDCGALLNTEGVCPVCSYRKEFAVEEAAEAVDETVAEAETEAVAEEDAKALDPVAAKEAAVAYPDAVEEASDPVAEEGAVG